MPVVKPISDLQRNSGAIAESCHKTKEPVCLTKNGPASLVVMDAETYGDQTRALTTIPFRNTKITFNVPSRVATTTSPTVACAPGNKQRQRQIGCEPSGKVALPHVTIL